MPKKTKARKCSECGKVRKCMVYDWLTGTWFCARDFKSMLADVRSSYKSRKKARR